MSVGVVVDGDERSLEGTLRSLLAQDHEALEVLLLGNGGLGGQYAARDARVRCEPAASPLGVRSNRLLERSSGEYFAWVSTSERWSSAALARCVEALEADHGVVLARPLVEPDAPGKLDTRGLEPLERCLDVVWNVEPDHGLAGVYRRTALAGTGGVKDVWAPEIALFVELSLVGAIAEVPGASVERPPSGKASAADPWRDRLLAAVDPDTRRRKEAMDPGELRRECRDAAVAVILDSDLPRRERLTGAEGILDSFEARFGVLLPLASRPRMRRLRSVLGLAPILLRREAEGGIPSPILE